MNSCIHSIFKLFYIQDIFKNNNNIFIDKYYELTKNIRNFQPLINEEYEYVKTLSNDKLLDIVFNLDPIIDRSIVLELQKMLKHSKYFHILK
jgi:hypothetical protein